MAALRDMSGASGRHGPSGKGGWWHNRQLAIVCFGIFLVLLGAQSLTGWREHNNDARSHHEMQISFEQYLTTGHFFETTFENWESEFLQMGAYVAAHGRS